MPTVLKNNELAQWIHGGSDLITTILMNSFEFLKHVTTEKKDDRYFVDGTDVTNIYEKISNNIIEQFSIHGKNPLKTEENEDYSALLGAYFRAEVINTRDTQRLELTSKQLETIYAFVKPYVADNFSSQELLDSVAGTPAQKHSQILSMILFNGITDEQKNTMSKAKYRTTLSAMLESMFNIIEFIRTPFRVLILEEETAKTLSKHEDGVQIKTSGVDLQWSSMLNAFKQSMTSMLGLKKANESKKDAEKFKSELENTLLKCQGSFGVENERYENNKILDLLGFESAKEVGAYINTFQQSLFGTELDRQTLPLIDLISLHHERWQNALDESEGKVAHLRAQLDSIKVKQDRVLTTTIEPTNTLSVIAEPNNTIKQLTCTQDIPFESKHEIMPEEEPHSSYQLTNPTLSKKKITLGALAGKLHLNDNNLQTLLEEIDTNNEQHALDEIETNLLKLEKINHLVLTINRGILTRSGFFSSAPYKKTEAISSAFEKLSLDEKIQLIELSDENIKTMLKGDSKIGKFLKEIKHNRGFSICEATSFKFFKQEINVLAKESTLTRPMTLNPF